jgi:putative oxidoreductase
MSSLLRKLEPLAFALMRAAFGALFVFHGLQKLFGQFGGPQMPYLSLAGAAGLIETAGGVLIAVGAFTVPLAFLASGEMMVAYFLVHAPQGRWPIVNLGELSLLYCAAFFYIATHGPGRLSIDALLKRR